VAFPARNQGQGTIRFNDTAGSMAKDSVFNAASVIRKLTGEDLSNYDLHVNVVGGGRIDGPSAGVAIFLAILSAIQGRPITQNVAVTGEISIQGKARAVGGVFEKIYGARQAGIKTVLVPLENDKDIPWISRVSRLYRSTRWRKSSGTFSHPRKLTRWSVDFDGVKKIDRINRI
jgi:ATP-dependent Lon protease